MLPSDVMSDRMHACRAPIGRTLSATTIILCQIIYAHAKQVIEVIRHPEDKVESKYNPDAGISKEDEERYQKLLGENEELQRLIVQVSNYIESAQRVCIVIMLLFGSCEWIPVCLKANDICLNKGILECSCEWLRGLGTSGHFTI